MLVLTRRAGERIRIGDAITISILDIGRGQVRVAIEAPRDIPVHREEVYLQVQAANLEAARSAPDSDPAALWRKAHPVRPAGGRSRP
jgi:carbon storage regulator